MKLDSGECASLIVLQGILSDIEQSGASSHIHDDEGHKLLVVMDDDVGALGEDKRPNSVPMAIVAMVSRLFNINSNCTSLVQKPIEEEIEEGEESRTKKAAANKKRKVAEERAAPEDRIPKKLIACKRVIILIGSEDEVTAENERREKERVRRQTTEDNRR